MRRHLLFLLLPAEISKFERGYLDRINRLAVIFLCAHVPALTLIAALNHTGPLLALALSSVVCSGPLLGWLLLENPRRVSLVFGVAAMFIAGLLVHFGQGPMQIEMHFYFFCLIALCAVFGNPIVVVAATATVALHHLVVWLLLPRSVFNYDAAGWVVAVHTLFVVLDAIATCFMARTFFDNVIGLERIVADRTLRLSMTNREMRLLLDNVEQGFLTIDRQGALARERSAAIDRWLGAPDEAKSWFDYLQTLDAAFASLTRLSFGEVVDGVMPLELTLAQMPSQLEVGEEHYRVEYKPIGPAEPHPAFLVIVTNVTATVERERAELERRESLAVYERLMSDRSGFEAFFAEGAHTVALLTGTTPADPGVVRRLVHTLKGNAAAQGLTSVAELAHGLEDGIAERGQPSPLHLAALCKRWARLTEEVEQLLSRREHTIYLDEQQHSELETAVRAGEPRAALLLRVQQLRLEPTERRLRHFAAQAQRIAHSLGKVPLEVRVEDNAVRLDAAEWAPYWAALIHCIRNAVDHGIESPEGRRAAGKTPGGVLTLKTVERNGSFVVEVSDDGRGIAWEEVRLEAHRAGLPSQTEEELKQALLTDGFSTAPTVTELSGRGIGLGALREVTRGLGGELDIETITGHGTTVRTVFPRPAANLS